MTQKEQLEEAFSKIPAKKINDDLYWVVNELSGIFNWLKNDNDYNASQQNKLKNIIKTLQQIDKSAKTFKTKEDVPKEYMMENTSTLLKAIIDGDTEKAQQAFNLAMEAKKNVIFDAKKVAVAKEL
jgi:hypothetical protein